MTTRRRDVIAAGAAFALPAGGAWPFGRPKGTGACQGRAAYAGGPLRAQIAPAEFDAAARAGAEHASPLASDDLDVRLEKAAARSQSFTAAIARSDRVLWTSSGGPAPASPTAFEWPGLADAYLATAILQLVEAGKLSLDSTIERWAPQVPAARWITLEDLLSHTSGLTEASPTREGPYCPGAGWSPAKADYLLLSRILEAVEGRPGHDALVQRIVEPLELRETQAPSAPGALTASAADVVRFWRGLMSGQLHSLEMTRHRFLRLYPMTAAPARTHWGLGVMVSDLAADSWNPADTWLGLSQASPRASAAVAYSIRKRAFAAVALTGEGSADAVIDLVLVGVATDPAHVDLTAPAPPALRRSRRRKRTSKPASAPAPQAPGRRPG